MSDWQIEIPFTTRSSNISAVADVARLAQQGDDREISRQITLALAGDVTTVGELLDRVEGMTGEERLELLNRARKAAGLPTTHEVDFGREWEETQARARRRGSSGMQICHADGCKRHPMDPDTGMPAPTKLRRWHCPEHRHLASEEDMREVELGIYPAPFGGWLEHDPEEEAREEARAESRRRRDRERREQRKAELEEQEKAAAARRAVVHRESRAWRGHD
jgi:hypothetical protein